MKYALDVVFLLAVMCIGAGVTIEFGRGFGLIAFGLPLAVAAYVKG